MKHLPLLTCAITLLAASTLPSHSQTPAAAPDTAKPPATPINESPILPAKKGDSWRYQVTIAIPAGVSAPDSPAVNATHERVRTYLGKLAPSKEHPEVDTFELVIPGSPTERELVDITDDRILMRGSLQITDGKPGKVIWLDPPVPFIAANIRVGSSLPELSAAKGTTTRQMAIVGREDVTVPAGTYRAIRMLMSGTDGPIELRRTIWFAPGIGIVKEEKTRYIENKLVFRETQQLVATSMKR